jgi:hypothetical protein
MLLIFFLVFLISFLLSRNIKEADFIGQKVVKQIPENDYVNCSLIEVKESEFGYGCFARENFEKGQIIERCLMTPLVGLQNGEDFPHLHTWSDDRKLWALASGCLHFYNHSDDPNVKKVGNLKENTLYVIALRDIEKGEELRSRYMSAKWRKCFQDLQ